METQDLSKLKIEHDRRRPATRLAGRRWILWAIPFALAALAIGFLAWSGNWIGSVEVQTAKVAFTLPSRALAVLNASGYVVAQRKAAVASKATGRLQVLYVEEGKQVKENEVLGMLENKDLMANLEEARAALKVANAALKNAEAELHDATLNYNRQKSLRGSGAVSEQALDAAEARYKKAVAMEASANFGVHRAQASVNSSEVNLEYSFIRAPFDGVILTKNADVGEVVAPFGASVNAKAAVVTMADMGSLMVEVDVSESSLEKVKPGGPTEIRLDALPNDRFPGRVHMIVPTADRTKATVLTKIKFDRIDPRVLPEMSAKVAFLSRPLKTGEDKPLLTVPASSIAKIGNNEIVYRINDGKAHGVPVTTARQWGDDLEVLAGLKEGDTIILKPDNRLKDGSRVKAKE
ncbi:MAG: efflux RND transporter periplasmic adaptor subunit [Desulfomonile tiedjei]|nr:efflux RND transporter periplasmic adaptor subunit [Desulfomonile tiedjei]